LSDPEFSLVIESLTIQGEHTQRVVHVSGGRLLGVLVQPEGYDLTIYPDRTSFQADLTGWLGLADHPLGSKENHILPDNEPMELIKLAWKSPEKAQTALRVANNPSPDATLAWAQSLQTASLMSAYSWAASESPVAQLFASANQSGAWMGSWSSESDQNIHLEPVDKDPALEKIFAIKLHPVIEKPD
jgi:hypothetical protein